MGEYPITSQERQYPRKPDMVQAIAVMTLVNGILNILYAFVATVLIVIFSFGIGLLCTPITILPGILGVFEILYAVKLLPDPIQQTKPNQTLAILEICAILTGNVVSLVIGILNLIFYNDEAVKKYFESINAYYQLQV